MALNIEKETKTVELVLPQGGIENKEFNKLIIGWIEEKTELKIQGAINFIRIQTDKSNGDIDITITAIKKKKPVKTTQ